MTEHHAARRRFLTQLAVAAAALPILGHSGDARAAPLPRIPVGHPQAKALGYVEDVRKTTSPAYKPASACLNCQFYTASSGACALFSGFSVAPKGWCTAWAKKSG